MTNKNSTIQRWINYCNAQGMQREAQAARLGLSWEADYRFMISNKRPFPDNIIEKMEQIIQGREILDLAVLRTSLLVEMEKMVQRCLNDKLMITLAAPTGQGKSIAGKYLAGEYGGKYYKVPTEMEKKKVASKKNFIRDLSEAYNITIRTTNGQRHLQNKITSDTRSVLFIDEAQRLISEDWGYFKVLQDLIDDVPNLSIIMLGNYRFYTDMYTDARRVYMGITDEEQFLRRISVVQKLPRLQKSDVKLWADYNNIKLKTSDHQLLAEFFQQRAALSDLENVRKEVRRIMGAGEIKSWNDVDASTLITLYVGMHTPLKQKGDTNETQEEEKSGTITTAKSA